MGKVLTKKHEDFGLMPRQKGGCGGLHLSLQSRKGEDRKIASALWLPAQSCQDSLVSIKDGVPMEIDGICFMLTSDHLKHMHPHLNKLLHKYIHHTYVHTPKPN